MSVFLAKAENGKLSLGSEYNRARFVTDLKKNEGAIYEIKRRIPESRQQRKFFEGAVIPLLVYRQEGMDYKNPCDLKKMRMWVQAEFCPEVVVVKGKAKTLPGSTKGKLNDEILERLLDWMRDNGERMELLDTKRFEKWRDSIRPFGGPDHYIEYLQMLKLL